MIETGMLSAFLRALRGLNYGFPDDAYVLSSDPAAEAR